MGGADEAGACRYFDDSRWARGPWDVTRDAMIWQGSWARGSGRGDDPASSPETPSPGNQAWISPPVPAPSSVSYWRYSHGTTWGELCDDLTVVDVPGDHFSLLRQDAPDMEPLVGGFVWGTGFWASG